MVSKVSKNRASVFHIICTERLITHRLVGLCCCDAEFWIAGGLRVPAISIWSCVVQCAAYANGSQAGSEVDQTLTTH